MRFRGRLKLPGDRGEGVVVDIRLDDIFLEVTAGGEELGRWRMDDVTIERLVSNEFALNLDGEPMVFVADDALAFAYEGVAAIGDVAARLTKKRRGLRRRSPEGKDGGRTPPRLTPDPPGEGPAGDSAGGDHRPVEPLAPVAPRVERPVPAERPAVVEPPAAAAPSVPIEEPVSVHSPDEPPVVAEPPAAAEPPVVAEPPAAAAAPANVPTAGETPDAGERAAGLAPRSPWIVPDDGAPDGADDGEHRRSAGPAPRVEHPVSPWIVPPREEAARAAPVLPEVFATVVDEEGAGTFAAEVAVIDLTEPVEPGDAIEPDGENGDDREAAPLAVVLPLHPVPSVAVPEHPAAAKSGATPARAEAGSEVAGAAAAPKARIEVPPEAPAGVSAGPVAPAPAAPVARREVERGGLFGRRRARSPEPHEHTYEEGGTVGGITRRVCTVCGHVSLLGADVYEGWQ